MSGEFKIVEFKIGTTLFAIDVEKTSQILEKRSITKVPNANPAVKGVFDLRGDVVPLIDLSVILKMDSDKSSDGKYIIVEYNSKPYGFLVDQVTTIKKFTDEQFDDGKILNKSNDTIKGILKEGNDKDDNIIIMLDFEKIINHISDDVDIVFEQ